MARRRWRSKVTRDGVLFLMGLTVFVHEVVFWDGDQRPWIIGACLTMVGLPAFLGLDEAKRIITPKDPKVDE